MSKELHLSRREQEVFRYLAYGHRVTAIGVMLGISVKTVSTYRTRLLEKLALKNNAELVLLGHKMKLEAPHIPIGEKA